MKVEPFSVHHRYLEACRNRNDGHLLMPTGHGGWSFCSCGAKTGPVESRCAQRRWHRKHRKESV